MMAILDINGNIALYTGPVLATKVHIPNHTFIRHLSEKLPAPRNSIGNQNTKSPFHTFPRRSSLLPTALQKPSNDNTLDDELHLLSPVPPLQSSFNKG